VNVSVVRTVDLDLSSDAGRRQLDRRLMVAAREVCGTASDADLAGKNIVRRCRDEVLAQAHARRDTLVASAQPSEPIAVTAAR
jgi:UrcA family protein